jgi:hypothetical protein
MACRTQCRLLSMNESYQVPSHEVCVQSARDLLGFEQQNGHRDWQALKRRFYKSKETMND